MAPSMGGTELGALITEVQQRVAEQAQMLQLTLVQQYMVLLRKHEEQQVEIARIFEVLLGCDPTSHRDIQTSTRKLRAEPRPSLMDVPLDSQRPTGAPAGLEGIGQQLARLQNQVAQQLGQISQEVLRARIARAREIEPLPAYSPDQAKIPACWTLGDSGNRESEADFNRLLSQVEAGRTALAAQAEPTKYDKANRWPTGPEARQDRERERERERERDRDRDRDRDRERPTTSRSRAASDEGGSSDDGRPKSTARSTLSPKEQECMTPIEHMSRFFGRRAR